MSKKIISMLAAAILLAAPISVLGVQPASAVYVPPATTSTASNLTTTSVDIDLSVLAANNPLVTLWHINIHSGVLHLMMQTMDVTTSPFIAHVTGLTASTTYDVLIRNPAIRDIFGAELVMEIPLTVTTTASAGSSSPAPPTSDVAEAAAVLERAHQIVVAAAKETLQAVLKSEKPLTLSQFSDAEITVASQKAMDRINSKLLALPAATRSDLAVVKTIVKVENFVEKVSTPSTQGSVKVSDLIDANLVLPTDKFKVLAIIYLRKIDVVSVDSIEEIQAAIKKVAASSQSRKDRLVAVKAKIASHSAA